MAVSITGNTILGVDPYRVTAPDGKVRLIVTDDHRKAGLTVSAFMHRSPQRIGMRIAGGCSGMTQDDKRDMIRYFVEGMAGFSGFVSSGGTRSTTVDGKIDPMVTDVPAALVQELGSDRILTLSTVPRTGDMALVDNSRLVLDADNGVLPQPGVHMLVVFQPEYSHEVMGWDGDVVPYYAMFNEHVKHGGWKFGLIIWNGGGVTEKEVTIALSAGWPVFIVRGSGRKADEIAQRVEHGETIPGATGASHVCVVVDRDNPHSLRDALIARHFSLSDSS